MSSYWISSLLISFYSYSILYNNSLSLSTCLYYLSYLSFYLYGYYLPCFLYRLPLFLFIRGLSLLLSAYLYVGYLSYILYGLSLFSFIYIPSFFLSVRGLFLLLTFYIYYRSSYSYGGCLSYLLSTRAVYSVCIATIELILEYILEMKSLT